MCRYTVSLIWIGGAWTTSGQEVVVRKPEIDKGWWKFTTPIYRTHIINIGQLSNVMSERSSTGKICLWEIKRFELKRQTSNWAWSWWSVSSSVVFVECDHARKKICIGVFGKDGWDATQCRPERWDAEGIRNSEMPLPDFIFTMSSSPIWQQRTPYF